MPRFKLTSKRKRSLKPAQKRATLRFYGGNLPMFWRPGKSTLPQQTTAPKKKVKRQEPSTPAQETTASSAQNDNESFHDDW